MRRADLRNDEQLDRSGGTTSRRSILRSFRCNLNQWGSLELRRRPARTWAATSTRTATFANNWSTGTGFNVRTRATFDDRATRGEGPGAFGNLELELLAAT